MYVRYVSPGCWRRHRHRKVQMYVCIEASNPVATYECTSTCMNTDTYKFYFLSLHHPLSLVSSLPLSLTPSLYLLPPLLFTSSPSTPLPHPPPLPPSSSTTPSLILHTSLPHPPYLSLILHPHSPLLPPSPSISLPHTPPSLSTPLSLTLYLSLPHPPSLSSSLSIHPSPLPPFPPLPHMIPQTLFSILLTASELMCFNWTLLDSRAFSVSLRRSVSSSTSCVLVLRSACL